MIRLHFPHFYVGRLALYNYLQLLNSHVHAWSPVILLVTAVPSVLDLIDAPRSHHEKKLSSDPLHTTRHGMDLPH